MTRIRKARLNDVAEIARVHVSGWHTTYNDSLPADVLEQFTVINRTESWRRILSGGTTQAVYVAEVDDVIVGFVSGGEARDDDLAAEGYDSEIYAIYLESNYQEQGIGRRLMHTVAADLKQQGYTGAYLWVLRDNTKSRGFYERLGGEMLREKAVQFGDHEFFEVAYGWSSLDDLIS